MKGHNDDIKEFERIAAGDAEAFSRVYSVYRNRVYGFAYRMVGNQSTAEDITQEAFMVLIKNPGQYRQERGSMLTFLCAVARNQILKYFRHQGYKIEDSIDEHNLVLQNDEGAGDPLLNLLDRELTEKVNDTIEMLPALQREVLVLREFQDLSYEEISIVTGVEVNVVKARLHRARQSAAKRLAPYMISKGEQFYELRKS
jgi:RNA polymerase sigma-70 factor (ECF subfamily)